MRAGLFAVYSVACGYGVPAPNDGDDDDTIVPFPTEPTTSEPGGPLAVTELDVEIHDLIESILVVAWKQSTTAVGHLEFSWDEGEWFSSPAVSRDAGTHEELILGAPYESTVTWRLVVTDGIDTVTSPDDLVANGLQPGDVPHPVVLVANPALDDTGNAPFFFAGVPAPGQSWAGAPWWAIIIDRRARVVWALESPSDRAYMHARVALDGRSLYLDHQSYWPTFDEGDDAEIEQTAIDGTVLHTFDTPGMHHPFTDMPDGSVAYGQTTQSYVNEHIVIVHRDGSTEDIFACEDWLEEIGVSAFCASNTLSYHEPTNKFLFSHYPFGTIIEVDRTTGQVDRWWGLADSPWGFDPVDSAFTWQHGGHITSAGTLLTSTDYDGPSGTETVVREYAIDDVTQTLREVANYGIGAGLYGGVMGEAYSLPSGNVIHNTGGLARMREYAPTGELAWDVSFGANAIGRSMPIVDLYLLKTP